MATKRVGDADELKRSKMARLRFRNIIRSVALNRIWLVDAADQKLSLNVKKNISMLVRTRRKIGILTMAEKSLIRMHPSLRTVEDRKKLVTLMAGLTCFAKIPPKVRARLSKVVSFLVIGGGRVLIKEGHTPYMVYYILTGEVEITKQIFNPITNSYENRVEMILGPGECFGDVEMIERCPRQQTYTSTGVVELLIIFEEDFDRVLRSTMEKQWFEKKTALMGLGYFKFFTREQIITACKLGTLRQFEPLETIYYEDKGQVSYVHFVVSGECMILQCLKMEVIQKGGKKTFELMDIMNEDEDMFQDIRKEELMKKLREQNSADGKTNFGAGVLDDLEYEDANEKAQEATNMDIESIEIKCGIRKKIEEMLKYNSNSKVLLDNEAYSENALFTDGEDDFSADELDSYNFDSMEGMYDEYHTETDDTSLRNKIELNTSGVMESAQDKQKTLHKGGKAAERHDTSKQRRKAAKSRRLRLTIDEQSNSFHDIMRRSIEEKERRRTTLQSLRKSIHNILLAPRDRYIHAVSVPKRIPVGKIENHFIDVGSLTFGSMFGLGERLEHRGIMARTTVQCLLIPRFWLLEKQQNPGNIWQRRRFYLDTTIPSRETLFKDFLSTRKWQKFKNNLIEENLDPNSIANPTHIQDVPIISRIIEPNEDL